MFANYSIVMLIMYASPLLTYTQNKLSNSEKAQYFVQLVLDWVGQKVRLAFSLPSFLKFIYF